MGRTLKMGSDGYWILLTLGPNSYKFTAASKAAGRLCLHSYHKESLQRSESKGEKRASFDFAAHLQSDNRIMGLNNKMSDFWG